MEGGKLRHRITIEELDEAQDSFGDTDPSEVDDSAWGTFISRRASIKALVGSETLQSGQEQAKGTHWVEFRHGLGVTAKMRVRFGSRVFDIESVENVDERNHEMRLLVQERL